MKRLLFISLGGAIGTGARYLIALWATKTFGQAFPAGTLIVNVAGCFLISTIMHFALASTALPETLRLTLTVGFLGGLTTYSSFNYELLGFIKGGAWATAALYFALTTTGALIAGTLGWFVGGKLAPA